MFISFYEEGSADGHKATATSVVVLHACPPPPFQSTRVGASRRAQQLFRGSDHRRPAGKGTTAGCDGPLFAKVQT